MTKKIIALYRVSTDDQGKAGNGLDAQRAVVEKFAADNNFEIVESVEEWVSGKLGLEDRPLLLAAVNKCLKHKYTLVVSKLDRLSRKVSFISNLMNTSLNFIVAEFGADVSPFMLHIHASIAEQERGLIGQRTKDALKALAARGKVLGYADHKDPETIVRARALGQAANAVKADTFAAKLRPTIERMKRDGMSSRAIAVELNTTGIKTARGGNWAAQTVINMTARWA